MTRFQSTFRYARNYLPPGATLVRVDPNLMLIQNYSDGFLLSQTLMSHEQMLAAGGDIIPYIREYHAYFDLIRVRK